MNKRGAGLVTSCIFKDGNEYVVRMDVTNQSEGLQRNVEITVTNKHTAETWHSSYDIAYIENLTHRTGNYKQFDVFVAMLKSGLLKSRECITLDLLTFEDLKYLRSHRIDGKENSGLSSKSNNRRYLILTYSVEFDRIHYPLPLEYSGAPDPVLLQATIRRLETKIKSLESNNTNEEFQNRIEELTMINQKLVQENQKLYGGKAIKRLMADIKFLENCVIKERAAFNSELQRLQSENIILASKLRQVSESKCRTFATVNSSTKKKNISRPIPRSSHGVRPRSRNRCRSRSPSVTGQRKSSLSRESVEILKVRDSARSVYSRSGDMSKEHDFGNLEHRINLLRKMLEDGIKLN